MDQADLFREAMKVFVRIQLESDCRACGKAPRIKSTPRRRTHKIHAVESRALGLIHPGGALSQVRWSHAIAVGRRSGAPSPSDCDRNRVRHPTGAARPDVARFNRAVIRKLTSDLSTKDVAWGRKLPIDGERFIKVLAQTHLGRSVFPAATRRTPPALLTMLLTGSLQKRRRVA